MPFSRIERHINKPFMLLILTIHRNTTSQNYIATLAKKAYKDVIVVESFCSRKYTKSVDIGRAEVRVICGLWLKNHNKWSENLVKVITNEEQFLELQSKEFKNTSRGSCF